MTRPVSRHSAEVPPMRRPGVVATVGVVCALLIAIIAIGASALASSGTSATDPSARTGAPSVVSPAPAHTRLPPPYVEEPAPTRTAPAGPALALLHAGAPLRRLTPHETVRQKAARVVAGLAQPAPFTALVGTLNVLGSQHTAGAGGFGPGVDRAAREAALIESRGFDVIGMQEVQRDQLGVFDTHLPGYTVVPQMDQSRQGYRLQIAYKTSRFTNMGAGDVSYLFSHMWIPLPWVLLRDNATGGQFYVIDAHNSPEGEQTERVTSSNIEIRLIDQLKAQHPVVFLGDLNEGGAVYCRLAAGTGMTASNGAHDDGGCYPGTGPIDWLMGTAGVVWSDDHVDGTTRATGMSDHNLVYATASITDRPAGQ